MLYDRRLFWIFNSISYFLGCIELQKPISALKEITSEGNEIWRPLLLKYQVKVATQPSLYLDVPIVDVRKAALESSLFSDVKVAAAFFEKEAAAADIGLHHLIMTESDPECLELELTLFGKCFCYYKLIPKAKLIFTLNVVAKKDFCTKMNDTEVEDLLAFLMNKISKYVNGGSSDIAMNMNDRIFILCIQTIGVLMSSYCLHVKSKVCNFPPFMNALFFATMYYVENLMSLCVILCQSCHFYLLCIWIEIFSNHLLDWNTRYLQDYETRAIPRLDAVKFDILKEIFIDCRIGNTVFSQHAHEAIELLHFQFHSWSQFN